MKNNDGKVSIIMPCYNGEKTLERAIWGVINQTYRPIEFILVNDGSTDNSEKVVNKMTRALKESEIEFKYIKQDNLGLGGAINTGLKHFTGAYLAWIDADDELISDSVQIRVDFLEKNPQYGCVSSNAYIVQGNDWNNPIGVLTNDIETNEKEEQFYELLMSKSIFCTGCHLVRTTIFDKANPNREIYPARHGQNWQMLLPVYYHSKRGFINIPLYKYGVYEDNMTAQIENMTASELYERRDEYITIIRETLSKIPEMDPQYRIECEKAFISKNMEQNLYTAIGDKDLLNYLMFLFKLITLGKFRFFYLMYPISLIAKRVKNKKRDRNGI